jgi:hypothetical protein
MSRTFAGAPPNPLSLGRIFCRHPPRCWRPQHSIKSVGLTRYAGVARARPQFSDFTWSVGDNRLPLPLD